METPSRSATLDLELEQFFTEARRYNFYQANRLIKQYCQLNDERRTTLRYEGKKSLAFPVADIDQVRKVETPQSSQIRMAVTFMGLYGPSSPLPAFYTERLLHTDDDSDAMRQLLDLMNHHLIRNLQTSWEKYRYYIQFDEGRDSLTSWLFNLAGLPAASELDALGLDWSKLLAMAPLLAIKTKNAAALKLVLEGYFNGMEFDIEQCLERTVSIPPDQCHAMGARNATMGMDLVMGDEVMDRMGKFRIHILDTGDADVDSFFPGESNYCRLKALVRLFLRDQFEFDLCLRFPVADMGNLSLGEQGPRMGWSTLMGTPADTASMAVLV